MPLPCELADLGPCFADHALDDAALQSIIAALPLGAGPLRAALEAATAGDVVALGPMAPEALTGALARRGVDVNPSVGAVDSLSGDGVGKVVVGNIRAVQPAAVRVLVGHEMGSGFNVDPRGRIVTAAHVVETDEPLIVSFPDGSRYTAHVGQLHPRWDVAVLGLDDAAFLPVARLAPAPPSVDDLVVVVGQPGAASPRGTATGYRPFHVSLGHVDWLGRDPLGNQSLGGLGHDAWTYWGHSGAPLFNAAGEVVAMHNSWDPSTGMRHAVTWQVLAAVLGAG